MKFLEIDLESLEKGSREISPLLQAKYLGGSGLAACLLAEDKGQADRKPLDPQNMLIFALGPLTGTGFPCSGRHSIVGRSPLTGFFAESDAGGRWGTELARAGWSGLIIKGKAKVPVYLLITQEGIEVKDARTIWGEDSFVTSRLLGEECGEKARVAAIGPSGEKQVPLACIMHDGSHARAAGRCGLGALMGSKNLKAVVVKGANIRPVLRDKAAFKDLLATLNKKIKKAGSSLSTCGTAGGIMSLEENGDLPIKNFCQSRWPEAEKLSGEVLAELYLTGRFHCQSCPIGCGREIEIGQSPYGTVKGAGPEYESVASLGSYCLVHDLEAVCKANDLCNRYGLDTISVGAAVAFGMEAYERGLVDKTDLGGLSLAWGDPEAMLEMVRQIGENIGFGAVLGQGVRQAARQLGPLAEEFALHVKGLELPAHDPRAFFSTGLSYATSNRGACHLAGFSHGLEDTLTLPELGYNETFDPFTLQGKGEMTARMQNLMGVFDSLKVCKFVLGAVGIADLIRGLELTTGVKTDIAELMRTGERIFNLKRIYNIKYGVSRKDDTLPLRILTQPRTAGKAKGQIPALGRMLGDYYAVRGWDEFGRPLPETLKSLGLKDL